MSIHPRAGKLPLSETLINPARLVADYYTNKPDVSDPLQRVSFGTSGHRGTSGAHGFNEDHVLAMTQAVCDFRQKQQINGPLYLGMDTHALSLPAFRTAIEVLAANEVQVFIQQGGGYTPTPVISHAILTWNKGRSSALADGIVITPSHNPPQDGGFKYNPPQGGPAEQSMTDWIQNRANELLGNGLKEVCRLFFERAIKADCCREFDYINSYVQDLENIVDMELIRNAGLKIGVDPLGGSGIGYWDPIAEKYGLDLEVVNREVDVTFRFMPLDRDGKIRMDCSSPYSMSGLIKLKDRFDVAFGNDPDYDRHGIVTRSAGLLNPNHYLAVAIYYLFRHRKQWPAGNRIGKTLVTSSMVDRIGRDIGREVYEVPVGFKWFVDGLLSGDFGFGGEESAGASFLRFDGSAWTTDKDGIIMDLLAAEITAREEKDPGEIYEELAQRLGRPLYERLQAPAGPREKEALKALDPAAVKTPTLAGEQIESRLTKAPGNNAPIGGLKVVAANGWFAARPSGTEDIYKIYCESFKGESHLSQIKEEAQEIVSQAIKS